MINNTHRSDKITVSNNDTVHNTPKRERILFLVDNHMVDDDAHNKEGADDDCISFTISLDELLESAKEEDSAGS